MKKITIFILAFMGFNGEIFRCQKVVKQIVVLASEPVGGRSRARSWATELPCSEEINLKFSLN